LDGVSKISYNKFCSFGSASFIIIPVHQNIVYKNKHMFPQIITINDLNLMHQLLYRNKLKHLNLNLKQDITNYIENHTSPEFDIKPYLSNIYPYKSDMISKMIVQVNTTINANINDINVSKILCEVNKCIKTHCGRANADNVYKTGHNRTVYEFLLKNDLVHAIKPFDNDFFTTSDFIDDSLCISIRNIYVFVTNIQQKLYVTLPTTSFSALKCEKAAIIPFSWMNILPYTDFIDSISCNQVKTFNSSNFLILSQAMNNNMGDACVDFIDINAFDKHGITLDTFCSHFWYVFYIVLTKKKQSPDLNTCIFHINIGYMLNTMSKQIWYKK